MIRNVWRIVVLLTVCGACMAASSPPPDQAAIKRWAAAHPVVHVVLDDQLGGEVVGGKANPLVTEYLEIASRNTGVKFESFRAKSWNEAVKAFHDGKADILPSLTDRLLVTDAGPDAVLSAPFYVGRTLIIGRTVGPEKLDLYALRGKVVAFRKGGVYEEWLRREHPEIQRLPLGDVLQVLAAVESGIAYAAIGVDVSYSPIVRRDYPFVLHVAGTVTEVPVTARVAVHRNQPELLALVQGSLSDVTDSDNERIVDDWLRTVYVRAPTVAQVLTVYKRELAYGGVLLVLLLLAMARAQVMSKRNARQKTMLLAVMSHEVRNAVNAVTSSVELLSRTPLSHVQHDLMAIALSGSRNLHGLLRNALEFSRNEAAGFIPDLAPTDAYAIARDALQSHQLALEQKGVDIRLDLPLGTIPWLLLDGPRLRQVLENLLGNAVKFTAKGHVGIALWQDDGGSGADHVRRLYVEVSDSGEGIPEDRQKEVFEAFGQAHGRRSRQLGGAGLGLAVCRDIVTQLGGTLELSSAVGVGTTVRLVLPTSLVPLDAEAVDAQDVAAAFESDGHALLVEDHPANRQVFAAQLRHLGYEVTAVGDAHEAIAAFTATRFEVVLLDCELPDMPGYDVARELRSIEARLGVDAAKLISISATTGKDHERRCEAAGIDVVLEKPLDLATLRNALSEPFDLDAARITFRKESLQDIGRMRTALAVGDMEGVARASHRMRGGALICGSPELAEALDDMESMLASVEGDRTPIENALARIERML